MCVSVSVDSSPLRTEKCSNLDRVFACFERVNYRSGLGFSSARRRRGKRWQWQRSWIVPDDLRPTPQRRCKEATAAGPCGSRPGVLLRREASAARRPSPLLSWLLLVGSELRLRGAPLPRIVGSPAHRRRQPKLLGLTVAGSTVPRHSASFSGGLFLSWFTYCGRMILDREHT